MVLLKLAVTLLLRAVGHSSSQQGSLSVHESLTSPDMTAQSSQSCIDSDGDEFTSPAFHSRSVQEAFTELIEAYDQSATSSEQQRRAIGAIWSFYAAHEDELEACAPQLEALLCNKHVSALEQSTPITRVSTSPPELLQPHRKSTELGYKVKQKLHRRSHSMS